MKITNEVVANTRTAIIERLGLLADPQSQRAYARNVPHVDVSAELVCGWFDDAYHPDSPAFFAPFNSHEIEARVVFSDLFDTALAEIADPLPPVSDLQTFPGWARITESAAHLFESLSGRSLWQAAAPAERPAEAAHFGGRMPSGRSQVSGIALGGTLAMRRVARLWTLPILVIGLLSCGDGNLRGSATTSTDDQTYLAFDRESMPPCGALIVDDREWPPPYDKPRLISPGEHLVRCGEGDSGIGFVVPEGTVFVFDYWGP